MTTMSLTQAPTIGSEARITMTAAPTEAAGANRSVKYAIRVQDIRRELELVMAELARRSGTVARGPIYLAG